MQIDSSLKRIRNQVNSIEINIMSRKTKNSGKLCLDEIDKQRQLAEDAYKQQEEIRTKYEEHDSVLLPAYIFCANDILDSYSLCPHIFLNFNDLNGETVSNLEKKRSEWLNNTSDKGELFKTLYERIHNQHNLKSIDLDRIKLVHEIDDFLKHGLTSEQYALLKESEVELLDYKNAPVKSKKKKEKFNHVINNISLLVGHTKLSLHTMLSIKYDLHFIINDVQTNDLTSKIKQDQFNLMIDTWKKLNDAYNQEVKYIKNTKEYSKIKLVECHLEYEKTGIYISPITQSGRYYKKWSSLKDTEKLDRVNSYSKYFVRKSFVMKDVVKQDKEDELVLKINTILEKAITEKSITSNSIKWNIKSGIITSIKGLEYNAETEEFTLTTQPRQRSVRKVSQRSIFSKSNENVINDVILKCVLMGANNTNTLTALKDALKINKISSNDRELFQKRFDEIKGIVKPK